MKKRALISLSDKTGAVEFAKGLTGLGYEIISTGGTAKTLTDAGIKNIGISDITDFPECLDGRVKTLHPAVHAGLLAMRSNKEHMEQLKELKINTIDVLAVNLYPFKATVLKGADFDTAVENIDIGGPSMLRGAAKNYRDVITAVDPADYPEILERLKNNTADLEFKKRLMYKVFAHTAVYDSLISNYLAQKLDIKYPPSLTLAFSKKQDLRYGENPHQSAAFYADEISSPFSLTRAEQLNGKELSFNNINDASGALDLLKEFKTCACVAVKHSNPCGVALCKTALEAYRGAFECDPVSIFGGVIAFNRKLDKAAARELIKTFLEIVIAPDYDSAALEALREKKNLRVLKIEDLDKAAPKPFLDFKRVEGGLLIQGKDAALFERADVKTVTKKAPTKEQLEQLEFAYKVVKHAKSNAIVVANGFKAIGVGGGQTNRIWAAKQALERAGKNAKGAVLASDAFFPFPDCAEEAAKYGISAIIQPGGSVKDEESIGACDEHGIAMVFVGTRHFKH